VILPPSHIDLEWAWLLRSEGPVADMRRICLADPLWPLSRIPAQVPGGPGTEEGFARVARWPAGRGGPARCEPVPPGTGTASHGCGSSGVRPWPPAGDPPLVPHPAHRSHRPGPRRPCPQPRRCGSDVAGGPVTGIERPGSLSGWSRSVRLR